MEGSLSDLKSAIRQKEIASGWPIPQNRSNFSFNRGKSNDNQSSGKSEDKLTSRPKDKDLSSKQDSSSKRSNREIPNCQICKSMGKAFKKHWHRDCPNRAPLREKSNHLKAILESDDEDQQFEAGHESAESETEPSLPINHVNTSRVWSPHVISAVISDSFTPKTFAEPRIFEAEFQEDAIFGEGNLFHKNGAAMVYARPTPDGKDHRYCWDTGTGPTVGNEEFCKKLFPQASIQKRTGAPLMVRAGFDGKEARNLTLDKFMSVKFYLPSVKGNLLAIKVEIHLTSAHIDSDILFGTATMKTNQIVCDFAKEVLRAPASAAGIPQSITVPLYLRDRRILVDQTVVRAKEDLEIAPGAEGLVRIDLSSLPDRDFVFEPHPRIDHTKGVYITSPRAVVDSSSTLAIVTNFGDRPFQVKKNDKIGFVSDLAANSEYTITKSTLKDDYSRPFMLRDFWIPLTM